MSILLLIFLSLGFLTTAVVLFIWWLIASIRQLRSDVDTLQTVAIQHERQIIHVRTPPSP